MSILRLGAFTAFATLLSCAAHATEAEDLSFGEYMGKIYSDGSGFFGKRFNPSKTLSCKSFSCEYKRNNANSATTLDNTWSFHVKNDEMTDQRTITASRHPYKMSAEFGEIRLKSNVYLWLNLSKANQEALCVAGHDFPGMKAMIRIDSNSPIETNAEGCLILTKSIDSQLRSARSISIRGYHWPYKAAETMSIDLDGYAEMSEYLRGNR